ncbi:glycosyltransferase family 2 protein [Roseomonas sp. E05]|uniref:glycosyltransferase family 2 protein n=1 Tax=Roseomonas sp. E05 TaxID=3046310 RepID=UPI0024B9B288|nr:glycosyltransferase family 2 protein [Roseomonas sp. E05]MDJ0387775.1 glycosyltransferase family 2 protein [Roseomonas sp. E05]
MPVRNGGDQIRTAIDSLLSQTHRNLRLIISDNCSTDDTVEICNAYARADPRVTVIRQPENLGICGNFRFVLMQADSPYFMWACHDDVWAPDFIRKNLENLRAHPTAVVSTSRVVMAWPGGRQEMSNGTFALRGTQQERLARFLWDPGEVSRFYGVFRTEALKRSFPADIDVFGYDWIVMALNLLEGEHLELSEVLLTREAHTEDHYHRTLVRNQPKALYRWFPHLPMTQVLRRRLPPEIWRACRAGILRRNAIQALMYAKYRMPMVAPAVRLLAQLERARARLRSSSARSL